MMGRDDIDFWSFRMNDPYLGPMRWMWRQHDQVMIINGTYDWVADTVESNVY